MKAKLLVLMSICGLFPVAAYASEIEHHHEAHVHGKAQLNLAMDGNRFEVELMSPAMNVLGFEHEARTEAQKESVHAAKEALSKAENVILIHGGSCELGKQEVSMPEHGEHGEHADITAHYYFNCAKPDEVSGLNVMLFDHFSGFEHVNVQWALSSGQGALEIDDHGSHQLTFK